MKYRMETIDIEAESEKNDPEAAFATLLASLADATDQEFEGVPVEDGVDVFEKSSGEFLGVWKFVFFPAAGS